jgi:hypothetical protein
MAKHSTPPDEEPDVNTERKKTIQTDPGVDPKALLNSAPLEGIDLSREQGRGRDIDLEVNPRRNTFRVRKEPGSSSSMGE